MNKCEKGSCNYCHMPRLKDSDDDVEYDNALLKYFDDNNINCGNCKQPLTVDCCPCCEHRCNKNYCVDCLADYLKICDWCARTSCCDKDIKLLPYKTWKSVKKDKKTYHNHICTDCNDIHKIV